jgi:hypothetical protein
MVKNKIKKEFQTDEEDYAVVPVEDVIVRPSQLKEKTKRPLSDKQKENVAKLVEANRVRWEKTKGETQKRKQEEADAEKERIREELRAEVEAKVKAGTHARVKVVKANTGPKRKAKSLPIVSETETEEETTEVDTEDEIPEPRHVSRQARRQIRTLAKIDEVIEQASNPYMDRLMGRWK